MRTSVKDWRCPCSFLYCFFRLKWKTRILLPRPSPTTEAITLADEGFVIEPESPENASTSLNSMVSPSCSVFSILSTSPGATRYCLPPVRMTAYIIPPERRVNGRDAYVFGWQDTCLPVPNAQTHRFACG